MFNLPKITLINDESAAGESTKKSVEMDSIERKVVINAGMLMNKGESRQQRVRTVADCLADAMGLCVDFNQVLQMS